MALRSLPLHAGIASIALALALAWERVWSSPQERVPFRDAARALPLAGVTLLIVAPLVSFALEACAPSRRIWPSTIPPVVTILVGFFAFELVTYWLHRACHAHPVLWRLHRVHHTHGPLHVLIAFQQHPVEAFVFLFLGNLPLVWLGMPAYGALYVLVAERTYTAVLHAARAPTGGGGLPGRWLGRVFASPRFHRAHHTEQGNYGGLVTIYDRWFGTVASRRS